MPPVVVPSPAYANKDPVKQFLNQSSPSTPALMCDTSVPSVPMHPFDAGFSFTYNKVQGATVKRLILVHDYLRPSRMEK